VGVYVEDWQPGFDSPYLVVTDDETEAAAVPVEDGDTLRAHPGRPDGDTRIAFVDGIRRVEATLYEVDDADGSIARGVAGAHGCGAVLAGGDGPPVFAEVQTSRELIFGSGRTVGLPALPGGWAWRSRRIPSNQPDAPLAALQAAMRKIEAQVAEKLCADGWLTVLDGPVPYVRSSSLPMVGYVKSHHRMLLSPDLHAQVPPLLPVATRSSLFAHSDRMSTYLRVAEPGRHAGPWSGIVRVELSHWDGVAAAAAVADRLAALLPRYAGVSHRDSRAPQNMQPVGALEKHLRHLLGPAKLAVRAVRDAVSRIDRETQQP